MERIKYEVCPVCTSKKFEEIRKGYVQEHPSWIKGGATFIQWMECGSCGHVFVNGYLCDSEFSKMVKKAHIAHTPGWNPETARAVAGRTVELVQLLMKTDGKRWLDVGCGDGSVIGFAQECGFKPYGIDVRADSVSLLKAAGLNVEQMDFMDLPLGQPYDVVSMRDVVEHMPFPQLVFEKAMRLTKNGGLLVVSTPSRESLAWKLPRPNGESPYWSELEHYHMFSAGGIRGLLENNRFEQVHARPGEHYRVCIEIIARRH